MKKLIIVLVFSVMTMILLVSCETDYNGSEPENQLVTIGFYQTTDTISNQTTRVSWYANDPDGYNLRFKYLVSSNPELNNSNCLDPAQLSDDEVWLETDVQYADVSFPFVGNNSYVSIDTMIINYDSLGVPIDTNHIFVERLDSRFFLYAIDEKGDSTDVKNKHFTRENRKPESPMLKSDKLGVQDIENNHFEIDDPILVLDAPTSNWSEIDFRWQGKDPDGQDVELEFRWELYAEIPITDTTSVDTLLSSSDGWSANYLNASFSDVIKSYADNAEEMINKYKFVVRVRDDALQESEEPSDVEFFGFVPVFNKSILVVDDTNDDEYDPDERTGDPDGLAVDAMYERLLNEAGYQINLGDDNQFDFDVWNVLNDEPPLLVNLTNYKLIIIHSEDRTNDDGINYDSYARVLTQYLDVGGKLFMIGNSNLILDDLNTNEYLRPIKKEVYADYSPDSFYYTYLGLYSYTEGEHFQRSPEWDEPDYSNYDFMGVDVFDHTIDTLYSMRLDTAAVNDYWFYTKVNNSNPDTLKRDFRLKENGSVFTGISTIQGAIGEIIMKYKSVYDCTQIDGSTYQEDSEAGDLYNNLQHNVDLPNNAGAKVLHRTGVVATRYISPGDIFRTAYFGFPLIFMSDDENAEGVKPVTKNFKAMITWFDIQSNE